MIRFSIRRDFRNCMYIVDCGDILRFVSDNCQNILIVERVGLVTDLVPLVAAQAANKGVLFVC